MLRILVIGRNGQVGYELNRSLGCLGNVVVLDRNSTPAVDLTKPATLRSVINDIRPHVIVNAAAYTAVDKAESERELAFVINAEAPKVLAEAAAANGALLVHYSTDYVFDGSHATPRVESDPTGPLGVYGESKLAGEAAIAASGAAHLIFRTAWVYGARGKNFLLTMLRLMRERPSVSVVNDQNGAPTWSRHIAEATALVLARLGNEPALGIGGRSGVYHLSAGGQTTWFGFAEAIREGALARSLLGTENSVSVLPIPTTDYPTPARRPAWSALDCALLDQTFGVRLPSWEAGLLLCLDDLHEFMPKTG